MTKQPKETFKGHVLDLSSSIRSYWKSLTEEKHKIVIVTKRNIYYVLHWCQYIIPTSLFYCINGHWFKFATKHKKSRQAYPSSILLCFSQGSIPESLVKKESQLTKLFNICWKWLKPYLFTHPNPTNVISWITSWTISWQIIPYNIERR